MLIGLSVTLIFPRLRDDRRHLHIVRHVIFTIWNGLVLLHTLLSSEYGADLGAQKRIDLMEVTTEQSVVLANDIRVNFVIFYFGSHFLLIV